MEWADGFRRLPVVDDGGDEPEGPVDPSDPSAIKVSIPLTTYTLPDDTDKKRRQ